MVKLGGKCFLEMEEYQKLIPWHRNTWYAKFRSGEISAERLGRRWLVELGELGKLLNVTLTEEEVDRLLAEARDKQGSGFSG